MKPPFFILGSPRSGTTILRDLLRQHPDLACPEETHFFRWGEPFKSTDYDHVNFEVDTLKQHRAMDGIGDAEFQKIYDQATDRAQLLNDYLRAYAAAIGKPHARVFDKTPQHAYGAWLIHSLMPQAQLVHLVRNPLNVVASLRAGRQFHPQSLMGAINFWREPVVMLQALKQLKPDLVITVRYEMLAQQPARILAGLLEALQEQPCVFDTANVHVARDIYRDALSSSEIDTVVQELGPLMQELNYPVPAETN